MSAVHLLGIAFSTSIALTVLALGLRATTDDVLYLWRRPGLLLRSLFVMLVAVPVCAGLLARGFSLRPAVAVVLVAIAVSPVPPFLPKKQLKAGGEHAYVLSLLATSAVVAIFFMPLAVHFWARLGHSGAAIAPTKVATAVATSVLIPLAAGILIARLAPRFAQRVVGAVNIAGAVLLGAVALVVVVTSFPHMREQVGDGTLVSMAVLNAFALMAGHAAGGPVPAHRVALALSSAARHPGLTLAVALQSGLPQGDLLGAVGLYFLVNTVMCIPYMRWFRAREQVVSAP
ncbi:MAG TPA: hypothetical protein VN680_07820 [Burkholderiaceae bacterium]|nr:hypothetical protein [Burkholderiaceae bacterium]